MKNQKLSILFIILSGITFSCNQLSQDDGLIDPNMVAKENRPKFAEKGCKIFDEYGNTIAAGVKCISDEGGGCKKLKACAAINNSTRDLAFQQFPELTEENWDGFNFCCDYDFQMALYNEDPDTY